MSLFLTLILALGLLTGCVGENTSIILKEDGTCSYTIKYMYEKSTYETLLNQSNTTSPLLSGDFAQAEETVSGTVYLTFSRSLDFANAETLKSTLSDQTAYINKLKEGSKKPELYTTDTIAAAPFSEVTLDNSTFIAAIASNSQLTVGRESIQSTDVSGLNKQDLNGYESINAYYKAQGIILDYSITLPAVIVESNGTISGNTASWSTETLPADGRLIASTTGNILAADTEAPVISGAKANGLYRKKVTLQASDNVGLKSFSINGIDMGGTKFTISVNGKHQLKAEDYNGNTTSLTFRIDTKAPKIKGLKKGRKTYNKNVTLKFTDNVGIQSVKLNGKNVNKKKITVKKAGRYVVKVTDKAGNVTTSRFTIAK